MKFNIHKTMLLYGIVEKSPRFWCYRGVRLGIEFLFLLLNLFSVKLIDSSCIVVTGYQEMK